MAVTSVVRKRQVEEWHRLDAEFWRPEYVKAYELALRSKNPCTLGKIAKRMKKGIFYILADEYVEQGVPFLRVSNVRPILLDTNSLVFISEQRNRLDKKTNFRRGDIVLNKTGDVGAAVIALPSCNISQDLIGLEIADKKKHNPYYVAAYLNTTAGKLQIRRWFQGQVQMHLALTDARKVLIPFPPHGEQDRIEGAIISAELEARKSESYYFQAEQKVLMDVGWHKLDLSQPKWYPARLQESREVHRLDAEFFQPKYYKLIEFLNRTERTRLLGEIAPHTRRGLQPEYVSDGEIVVVNSQHLGRYLVNLEATERTGMAFWKQRKKARLRKNDVLIYSTGAYIGRTNVWLEDREGIASNHVTIVRPDDSCNPAYLSVYLNSPLGILQAERWASGSGQREIYPQDIAKFVIYTPDGDSQRQVAELVQQAHQARRKAKEILKDVTADVEALIQGKR